MQKSDVMGTGSNVQYVPAKLRQILKDNMISGSELARGAGLSEGTVRNILAGRNTPREETKRKIVAALNKLPGSDGGRTFGSEVFD